MHQCMPWVSCWARYACISRLAQVRNHTPNGVPSGMITLLIVLLGNAFGLHHRGPAKFCWDDVFKPNAKVFHLHTPKAGVFTLSTYWRLPKDIPTSFGAERDAYSTKSFFFSQCPAKHCTRQLALKEVCNRPGKPGGKLPFRSLDVLWSKI